MKPMSQIKRQKSALTYTLIFLYFSLFIYGCSTVDPDLEPELRTLPNSGWLGENETNKKLQLQLKERNTEIIAVNLRWGTRKSIHDRNKLKHSLQAIRSETRDDKGFYTYEQEIEGAANFPEGTILDYQFEVTYRPRGEKEQLLAHTPLKSIVTSVPGANMTLIPQQVELMVGEKERLEIMIHPPLKAAKTIKLEVQPKGKVKIYDHNGDKVDKVVFKADDTYHSLVLKGAKGHREGLPVTISASAVGLPTEEIEVLVKK